MSDCLLMIFVKNPVAGKVKTRLASTIGDHNALQVYRTLLAHTRIVASRSEADKQVWYSSIIDRRDRWDEDCFQKHLQKGENLGKRMMYAFKAGFDQGYRKLVIIGSDCAELKSDHIKNAFEALESNDAIIGPSKDGGYYLLGLSAYNEDLFKNINWSTPSVFDETVEILDRQNRSYKLLEKLNDIDTEEDLLKSNLSLPHVD